ncbi:MAG: bifunctional nuclease family protein [Deltaproteobacteria bacterium]|nr:bifunctional nuclease family protein [Candidatus Zymogenaceae bacterium]
MAKEMEISGLAIDPLSSVPIVILKEVEGKNSVPIWIGLLEASAIATVLEEIEFSRPMTHDLLKNIMETMNIVIERIVVDDLKDNTYYATIYMVADGRNYEIDSRPSDAIAIALRTQAKIYMEESVIERSRKIDLTKPEDLHSEEAKKKWAEVLEKLDPDDFGKYKM